MKLRRYYFPDDARGSGVVSIACVLALCLAGCVGQQDRSDVVPPCPSHFSTAGVYQMPDGGCLYPMVEGGRGIAIDGKADAP